MTTQSSSNATRSSLLLRAAQRDAQAWRELVDLYGPLVSYWCRRCQIDSHAAADCVQDVFTSVAVSIETFHPQRTTGSFRAWLWTVTRNKLRDHFRRVAGVPKATGGSTAFGMMQQVMDPFPVPDEEPTGEFELQQLTTRAMTQVQSEFEPRSWQAFWRSVVDGIATDEVARELQISSAAVRQSRSRILRRLRQQLGDLM
ncbi:MAG TPA: sigma-70 family RNA polymerase sigma factor [Planctomycetaceae bacterium]|mgnify:CR=1 FL=1|nr:sigma-70 family RNA polymerase sigma factor [Planctomycetaceae bacterium]HQZ64754.1 sigma-70 family RNA polymerase sigma factor [Planctomycetaceae bacterium]HRA87157.1 sigma-70 family RNA polymerase sigma factor [Planctomycetaceae bacterium]